MAVQGQWLIRGSFDQSAGSPGQGTTQAIRDELSAALHLPHHLAIAFYPVGPTWKHTFWWREGTDDYAEAQFFARIAGDYPILSLGISVEKGLEEHHIQDESQRIDRETWAWPRLVTRCAEVLAVDLPRCAADLQRPISVRIRAHYNNELLAPECATFCFIDNAWFRRYRGTAQVTDVSAEIAAADQKTDRWIDVHFVVDLGPSEADGLSPAAVANLLLKFEPIRRRLHR